ncbi:MAG TPA: permease, partial [Bacteroidia bacterium]|nr:permease [Bacteroidia bacterium]
MDSASLSPFTDFCLLFLSIVLEGAPFILLGTLISGIIDAYLPPGLIDRWLPKNKVLAVILSGLLGAVFPVCECAVVPVIRRLIRKGLPVSCAITYMLSAPIINPIVVVSTMKAFSTSLGQFSLRQNEVAQTFSPVFMTSSRLLVAFIVTVLVGLIVLKVRNQSIL